MLSVWHTQADYIIDNYFSFLILKERCIDTPGWSENQTPRADKKAVLSFKYSSSSYSQQHFYMELIHLRSPLGEFNVAQC